MKNFIIAKDFAEYIDYVKGYNMNPDECFFCATPEEAAKDCEVNIVQKIESRIIDVRRSR
jgi:hypothetical protein